MYRLYFIHLIKRFIINKKFKGKNKLLKFISNQMPEMKDDIIIKTLKGFKLKIFPKSDDGIEKSLFKTGIYEDGTLWCFKKIIKPGDIILDAGANIGLTSIYASKLTGSKGLVYSFEPMPCTLNILRFNLLLNKIQNVKLFESALSDKNGTTFIYSNSHINRGAASLKNISGEIGLEISVQTLDSLYVKENLLKVNFVKIDIEGAEYQMLKGSENYLLKLSKPIICLEYSNEVKSDYNPLKIIDLLHKKYNYRVFKHFLSKSIKSPLVEVLNYNDLPEHDNLYFFQEIHFGKLPKSLFLKFDEKLNEKINSF